MSSTIEIEEIVCSYDNGIERLYSLNPERDIFKQNRYQCMGITYCPSIQMAKVIFQTKVELIPFHQIVRMTEKV